MIKKLYIIKFSFSFKNERNARYRVYNNHWFGRSIYGRLCESMCTRCTGGDTQNSRALFIGDLYEDFFYNELNLNI